MARPSPVVLLHDVAVTPQSWQHQVEEFGAEVPAIAPWLVGLRPGRAVEFSLPNAAAGVVTELDRFGAPQGRLCGVGLGATVALETALTAPERVERLVLCAPLVKPPGWAMKLQRAAVKMMPARRFAAQGLRKDQVVAAMSAMSQLALSGRPADLAVDTMIVIGEQDRANLPAAKMLAATIPGARLQIVPEAGHPAHVENPAGFHAAVGEFLTA